MLDKMQKVKKLYITEVKKGNKYSLHKNILTTDDHEAFPDLFNYMC